MTDHDGDLDGDIREHIELETEDNVARGMSREEARYAALRKFGNVTRVKEQTRAVWTWAWLESCRQDVRYALRSFRKAPAFVFTVVGTIGLALGLNTTLFTIFDAYVLRPFAVRDPYNLYRVDWSGGRALTVAEFDDLRKHENSPFSEVLGTSLFIGRAAGYQMVGEQVSGNYFQMLGAGIAQGRPLLPGDTNTAVIGELTWKNKFGAAANIIGRSIELQGGSYEIVGVARGEFSGMSQVVADVWIPIIRTGPNAPKQMWVVGRLRPDIPMKQATAALQPWARVETARRPEAERASGVGLESAATSIHITWQILAIFAPLVVAFVLVLLIACANVANMMLARAMARQREIGVRLSLGAGRGRLIRQLMTEALLLALPAGLLGVVVSQATLRLSEQLMFATAPAVWLELIHFFKMEADWRVFLFVLAVAMVATFAFGLVPAIQATRSGLYYATRGEFTSDIRPARLRNTLVAAQVTVCVLLLICSGVLLRSTAQFSQNEIGMDTKNVFQVRIAGQNMDRRIVERLEREPGVESLAAVWRAPLYGSLWRLPVGPMDRDAFVQSGFNFVSPKYFDVFHIAIARGRGFSEEEGREEAAVTIVSGKTAALFWPGADPIGQTIRINPSWKPDGWVKAPAFRSAVVIGVAQDVMSGGPASGIDPTCFYFPTDAAGKNLQSMFARIRGDVGARRRKLDAAIASVADGSTAMVIPTEQAIALQLYPYRVASWIGSALGCLALVFTLSGIYGVLAYFVTQRTKEIGIRMALGASKAGVVRLVMVQSVRLAAIGIVIGMGLGLVVSKLFAAELEGVNTFDGVAYAIGILIAIFAALTASYLPSRRAAAVDPMVALRCD